MSAGRGPASERGIATVELGLVLPILLVLALGVIDLSRAIQFNNVLINLSREGANLASRTTESPQYILKTLMDTAAPLPMNTEGMMIITKLVGRADGQASVEAQYRPASGGKLMLSSALWACSSWACSCPVAGARCTQVRSVLFGVLGLSCGCHNSSSYSCGCGCCCC